MRGCAFCKIHSQGGWRIFYTDMRYAIWYNFFDIVAMLGMTREQNRTAAETAAVR